MEALTDGKVIFPGVIFIGKLFSKFLATFPDQKQAELLEKHQ